MVFQVVRSPYNSLRNKAHMRNKTTPHMIPHEGRQANKLNKYPASRKDNWIFVQLVCLFFFCGITFLSFFERSDDLFEFALHEARDIGP